MVKEGDDSSSKLDRLPGRVEERGRVLSLVFDVAEKAIVHVIWG